MNDKMIVCISRRHDEDYEEGVSLSPCRILSQTITHAWESLCGSSSFQRRSSSTWLEQNIYICVCVSEHISEGKKNSLTCIICPPRQHSSVPRNHFLGLWFLWWDKVRACKWAPGFPSSVEFCQRGPFFFLSHPEWLGERLGEQQIGLSEVISVTWILLTISQTY